MDEQTFEVGETVWDQLTRKEAAIVGKTVSQGRVNGRVYHGRVAVYWLDNDWVGGGRHPWEITRLNKEGNA